MGTQMDSKITQKPASAPQGRPEASRESVGTKFGLIVGLILDASWVNSGMGFRAFGGAIIRN